MRFSYTHTKPYKYKHKYTKINMTSCTLLTNYQFLLAARDHSSLYREIVLRAAATLEDTISGHMTIVRVSPFDKIATMNPLGPPSFQQCPGPQISRRAGERDLGCYSLSPFDPGLFAHLRSCVYLLQQFTHNHTDDSSYLDILSSRTVCRLVSYILLVVFSAKDF